MYLPRRSRHQSPGALVFCGVRSARHAGHINAYARLIALRVVAIQSSAVQLAPTIHETPLARAFLMSVCNVIRPEASAPPA